METENLVSHESSRMTAFQILSDCFFLPDTGLSEKLEDLEFNMTNVCETAVPLIQNMRKEFKTGADLEHLKVDFAKLFVGPYQLSAAPYGSVYLESERKMMGDSTLDVRNRYQEAGLDTAKNFKDAPDHIAAELEFMYYLIFKEFEAFSSLDMQTATDYIQKQKLFLEYHLMAWVPEFVTNIIEHAETLFYQYLAKVTESFLKKNYEIVGAFLESKELNSKKCVEINSLHV